MIEQAFRQEGFATVSGAVPIADLDSVAEDVRGIFVRRAVAVGLAIPGGDSQEALSQLLLEFFERDRDSYLAAARQTQYLASVHRFGLSPAILQVLNDLGVAVPSQSTRPVVHFIANGLRIEGG